MKEKYRVTRDGELVLCMDEEGRELPDPVPEAPPVGFQRQQPLHERIRAMVQHEYERARLRDEVETPEEADDFIIGDEDDPREGRFALMPGYEWEDNYEPPSDFREMRERLISAGWTPPKQGQEASAVKRSESEAVEKPLDAAKADDNRIEAAPAASGKQS